MRAAGLLVLLVARIAGAAGEGTVRFVQDMHTATFANAFLSPASPATQTFINAHYVRALVSSPFFNPMTSWYAGKGWVYQDLYAVDPGGTIPVSHPDWILKDAMGHFLYIPFACNLGVCSQFAGDPGLAAFRNSVIASITTKLGGGNYAGVLLDDVDLYVINTSNGNGTPIVPIDPRTGLPMTLANWRLYMAGFTQAIRAAFPSKEIVHNTLWFAGAGDSDVNIANQIAAGDVMALERGVNDSGIVGDGGTFGFATLVHYVDDVHGRGKAVWWSSQTSGEPNRTYGLAMNFMMQNGSDDLGNSYEGGTPTDFWSGYTTQLGNAATARTITPDGVYFRGFDNGIVYVNPPENGTRTEAFPPPGAFVDLDGVLHTGSISLGPASGAVLLLPAPATTSTTSGPPTTTTTTLPEICGDVDGDGKLTIGDALTIAQYAVGQRTCSVFPMLHPSRCDVNNDGLCTILDAQLIQHCLAFNNCGVLPCGTFTCPGAPDPSFMVLDCSHANIHWDLVPGATETCIQNVPNPPQCFAVPQTDTVVTLVPNTTTVWVVYAIVNGGQSFLSPILDITTLPCTCTPAATPPAPPSNFAGIATDCTHIHFTWTASPTPGVVQYCIGNRSAPDHPYVCVAAPATSANLTVAGSPFPYSRTFQIWAVDGMGNLSTFAPPDPRNPLRVAIPPCGATTTSTTTVITTTTTSSTVSTTTTTHAPTTSTTSTTAAPTTTTTSTTAAPTTTTTATTSSTTTTTAAGFCASAHNYLLDAATLGLWRFNSAAQFGDSKDANMLTNNGCNPPDMGTFQEGDASLQCAQTSPNHVYAKCSNASCADLNIGSASANTQKISGGCWWRVNAASLLSFAMDHAFNLDGEDGWQLVGATSGAAPNAFVEIDGGEAACPGNIEDSVTGTTTLLANTWYHLAFTSDNVNLKLYVDGVSDGSTPHTTGVCANTTEQFEWGGSQGDTRTDTTNVDECFLRNDALTASDLCHICRCGYDGTHADRGSGACGGCS